MALSTLTSLLTQTSGTWTATSVIRGRIRRVALTWISTAGGAAVCVLPAMYGFLKRIATVPDGGGTAPSNNYTLAVKGPGANLHSAANADTVGNEFSLGVAEDGGTILSDGALILDNLTLTIGSAGNAKGGTIYLYFDLLS